MTRRVGPWIVTSDTIVYDNPWIRVVDHAVLHPNGKPGQYGVVRFKNRAIGVLAIDGEGRVPLVGQHRFPHDAYSWELPEGGGPLADDPLDAARRELKEETGCTAAHWLELAAFDVSNSVTDEVSVCYLAWGLTDGEGAPEDSEAFAHDRPTFAALHERVLSGDIRDSLTILMTLTAVAKAETGRLPPEAARIVLGALGRTPDIGDPT